MQSRVVAFAVFLNHSITILSSSSPTAVPLDPFRFFVFPTVLLSSSAFRLLLFDLLGTAPGLIGLPGLFISEGGLIARLARGLPARLVLGPLGTFGLVARLATTEWPPRVGEVARGPTLGNDGLLITADAGTSNALVRGGGAWIAGPVHVCVASASSSSSSSWED
jgi:hypothetical protein